MKSRSYFVFLIFFQRQLPFQLRLFSFCFPFFPVCQFFPHRFRVYSDFPLESESKTFAVISPCSVAQPLSDPPPSLKLPVRLLSPDVVFFSATPKRPALLPSLFFSSLCSPPSSFFALGQFFLFGPPKTRGWCIAFARLKACWSTGT